MAHLVTLQEARDLLRLDGDDHDSMLALLIPAASASVVAYLKTTGAPFVGEDGEVIEGATVPFEVRAATVMLIGMLMRNPDNDTESAFPHGYLPNPVLSLLYSRRTPTLA